MRINLLVLFGLMGLLSLTTAKIFSQQEALAEEGLVYIIEQWVLGDVIAIDLEKNQLKLGYVDYNTDEAKEIAIGVDVNTNYENVNSLADIKINDVVAVDYETTPEGEAMASNINVERF